MSLKLCHLKQIMSEITSYTATNASWLATVSNLGCSTKYQSYITTFLTHIATIQPPVVTKDGLQTAMLLFFHALNKERTQNGSKKFKGSSLRGRFSAFNLHWASVFNTQLIHTSLSKFIASVEKEDDEANQAKVFTLAQLGIILFRQHYFLIIYLHSMLLQKNT